ncbi:MAG: 50S ribosomal protein L10 [Patescibacteria group bacterium]
MITKQKKAEILENLKENIKKIAVLIFINFHGLSVAKSTELRRILRKNGAKYMVVKKTLIKKALDGFGFTGEMPALEGEIALAISSGDPIALAKELKQFSDKKNIKLTGGIFENRFIDEKTVIMLANIPPKEVLLARFVNVVNSPIQGTVVTLNGVINKFVRTLNEITKTK